MQEIHKEVDLWDCNAYSFAADGIHRLVGKMEMQIANWKRTLLRKAYRWKHNSGLYPPRKSPD
jgi:hypothetical protein